MSIAPKSQYEHRVAALQILYAYMCGDVDVEQIVLNYSSEEGLELAPDSFCLKIVAGVIEHSMTLDEHISSLSENWKIERIELIVRIILRIAIWELIFIKTPSRVVIDQAIELSKDFSEKDSYRFVNGILDQYINKAGFK